MDLVAISRLHPFLCRVLRGWTGIYTVDDNSRIIFSGSNHSCSVNVFNQIFYRALGQLPCLWQFSSTGVLTFLLLLAFQLCRYDLSQNKPKMAYSRDFPKMAGQQCGIMD